MAPAQGIAWARGVTLDQAKPSQSSVLGGRDVRLQSDGSLPSGSAVLTRPFEQRRSSSSSKSGLLSGSAKTDNFYDAPKVIVTPHNGPPSLAP